MSFWIIVRAMVMRFTVHSSIASKRPRPRGLGRFAATMMTVLMVLAGMAATITTPAPAAHAAGPRPLFQLPFTCGQLWQIDSYDASHAPALDMVRDPDSQRNTTEGQPLLAPAAGRVNQSFYHSNAGNVIQIDHGGSWFTTYIHLQTRNVAVGATIHQGQQIGRVGHTGPTSNGTPHLHYELAIDSNGDGRASWGQANSERVPAWFDGVEYGAAPGRTYNNVASKNCTGASLSGDARAELILNQENGELLGFPNVDGLNFNWGPGRIVGAGWHDPARTFFADLDGDGKKEVILNQENGELLAFPNVDGLNFNWGLGRIVGAGWHDPARTFFADLNGDRRAELILNQENGELLGFPNIDGLNFNWGPGRIVGAGWYDPARTFFA